MLRKLLSSILCVLLAVMLPLCAFAATEGTLTIIPGDELASNTMIKDLCDALAFKGIVDLENNAGSFVG